MSEEEVGVGEAREQDVEDRDMGSGAIGRAITEGGKEWYSRNQRECDDGGSVGDWRSNEVV